MQIFGSCKSSKQVVAVGSGTLTRVDPIESKMWSVCLTFKMDASLIPPSTGVEPVPLAQFGLYTTFW